MGLQLRLLNVIKWLRIGATTLVNLDGLVISKGAQGFLPFFRVHSY